MKKIILSLLFVFSSAALFGQVAFHFDPGDTVSGTAADGGETLFNLDIYNDESTDIMLDWNISSSTIDSWASYRICDNNTCYFTPPSGTIDMNSISAGGKGFIKIYVEPFATGTGEVRINIFPDGDVASTQIATFLMDAVVGVDESLLAGNSYVFYPNPINDGQLHLRFTNPLNVDAEWTIIGLDGRVMANGRKLIDQELNLEVNGLSQGIYFLEVKTKEGTLLNHKFVQNR